MTQATKPLTYLDIVKLEDTGWAVSQLDGLWHWEVMGPLEYLGIGSADGHTDIKVARDQACDEIALCAEWGTDKGLEIIDRTIRLTVCIDPDDVSRVSALSLDGQREAIIPAQAKAEFVADCYGWDEERFQAECSCPVRMTTANWEAWLKGWEYR